MLKKGRIMTTSSADEPLKAGTLVKLLRSGFKTGRIVEYRGPLAPGGVRVYGIRVGRKPSHYTEVPETMLEVLPPTEKKATR
jgi:hypothetical protein